jgi:propionyl-CoA carboxylase alpha chain
MLCESEAGGLTGERRTTNMFKKILIANRGEIACRVMRTARRMGIATVAVYSEADKNALHVDTADEAVCIGPAPSAESYLRADRIIEACKHTGAEAVHPGYGFPSENADFADALDAAGIAFIGPARKAIEAMGDKITSKRIAEEAGVNVIPGYTDVVRDTDHALEIARDIGFPVMLKASAGGGGKGMRVAWDEDECREGFERASSEARSSFGDDRVFIEKFIQQPRHIEIQVLADGHGNALYLGERECSIQRRHQKVIEEAPSPLIDEATRRSMGEQAVALARAVDYRSAGTVEFVADSDRNFYFLEMNTRLQVEHPVTEKVTGLDLVELMIRVAAGEPLALTQDQITLTGWALECRVYAEDALRGFLPSTGRLVRYLPPEESEHVRVDTGVFEGGEVSMFYDPMVAKLVTYGAERSEAIALMRQALDAYYIRGIETNIPFLAALMAHPRFVDGRLTTNFIDDEYPDGFGVEHMHMEDADMFVVVAAAVHRRYRDRAAQISGQMPGYKRAMPGNWVVIVGGEQHPVRVTPVGGGQDVRYDGRDFAVRTDWQFGQPLFRGTINGRPHCMQVERRGVGYQLFQGGGRVDLMVLTERAASLQALMPVKAPPDLSGFLLSPMPGLLLSLSVKEGDHVKAGQELAVIEAMKMENVLRADKDRVVAKVMATPGNSLAVDQKILEFE